MAAGPPATPEPAPGAASTKPTWPPPRFDLKLLLLPADWSLQRLEEEGRRIYFQDLVASPPETPEFGWFEKRTLIVPNTEGAFRKIFGKSVGFASYSHRKTGELDPERLRTAAWIRPILELRVPKTEVYVNNHSMEAREYGPRARREKKRVFVTLGKDTKFFISLVYTEFGLALSTAFVPGDQWLREMKAKSTRLTP